MSDRSAQEVTRTRRLSNTFGFGLTFYRVIFPLIFPALISKPRPLHLVRQSIETIAENRKARQKLVSESNAVKLLQDAQQLS